MYCSLGAINANRDADWLLDQLGWRLDEAELTFALHLQLQQFEPANTDKQ